jgi:uncharacterized protein (DUF362 family)
MHRCLDLAVYENLRRLPAMKKIVLIQRLADEKGLVDQFSNAFGTISLDKDFARAKAVFIKPNLTYPTYKKGVTTRIEFVEALVAALRRHSALPRIYVGEGEGGYNAFSMTDGMRVMGYYEMGERHENVEIVNLSNLRKRTLTVRVKGRDYPLEMPELFDDVDFSITCPLPKVHCMTGVTLSHKNQWGCVPDIMRLKNHYVFHETIGQICDKLKFRYAFLDGKYGLDENGPMLGSPVEVNWFVASNSLGAFDMIVSEMMGFDWRKIGHLRMADKYGYMPRREDIEVEGDIESLRRKFVLKRNVWNYPALAAFHSKPLTHLFYFSGWAKLLHSVMYTFRKRPID